MNKIIDDLSAITTISNHALVNLVEKAMSCICHDVCENIISGNPLTEIDIGIGVLYIKLEGENIKYKFLPSKKLEEYVASTVELKISPLVLQVDEAFRQRIESTYKDLL